MAASNPLTISLTAELRAFIAAQVATGRYKTSSEVVRASLRLLERSVRDEATLPGSKNP